MSAAALTHTAPAQRTREGHMGTNDSKHLKGRERDWCVLEAFSDFV